MKKKFFPVVVVAATLAIGYNAYNAQKSVMSDTLLANVEALAVGDDGGTDVGQCYMKVLFPAIKRKAFFCNDKTTFSRIYPCPLFTKEEGFDISKTNKCTK